MSSRALRRLQKEQEEQRLREQAAGGSSASEDEAEEPQLRPAKKSAFDLLNEVQEDEDEDDDDEGEAGEDQSVATRESSSVIDGHQRDVVASTRGQQPSKKSKSKKKKKKAKSKTQIPPADKMTADADLDEIDLALRSLGTSSGAGSAKANLTIDRELQKFYALLAIDKQHLNPLNEMKKLFGSVVLERDDGADAAGRQDRTNQGVAIPDFLSARYSRVSRGQGLSGLALRQNTFLAGKPEWPKVASGGLSMELVERADDFTIEYRFVHSGAYQRVQKEFEQAVQTIDPQAVFQMVYNNPYHISSLLQTAEIVKQQGDNSVAADMYERALYNFGRSVQSTFASALSEGKARMDFRRPENREFWLAGYRYIGALVQKGTFRTAYEWAKLLLSLDPEGDPYCVRLIIDQLAVRGGQSRHLIDLASTKTSIVDWGQSLPNVRVTVALAHHRIKELDEAIDTLKIAVKDYPWLIGRLYQQLDADSTPRTIWGILPKSPLEKYQAESYAARARDIWNSPEALNFLNGVAENVTEPKPVPADTREITLDEARHALISEIPALISTVPREYTTIRTTASDPLPPPDSISSYSPSGGQDEAQDDDQDGDDRNLTRAIERARQSAGEGGDREGLLGMLGRALNIFRSRAGEQVEGGAGPEESLGAQMGMEEVRVRTLEEYEDAQNRGQWPVFDEAAAPDLMRQLGLQQGDAGVGNPAPRAAIDQAQTQERLAQREQQAVAVREAQSRRQATVEDEDDNDSDNAMGRPQATSVQDVVSQPSLGSLPRAELTEMLSRDYDNDANKRWLAGRGMMALKEFVNANGADEKVWLNDPRIDKAPVNEYLARVPLLQAASDKTFILEYALKQGAGPQTSELIQRLL